MVLLQELGMPNAKDVKRLAIFIMSEMSERFGHSAAAHCEEGKGIEVVLILSLENKAVRV